MATSIQHLGLSALAIDRMSPAELMRRGLVTFVSPVAVDEPTPAEECEAATATFRPITSEIPGVIYVLQALPILPVKIGFTRAKDLAYRVSSLQTGTPYPLKILARATGLPAEEREAHALLAADRLTGEWFDWTPRVQAFVHAMQGGMAAALSCGT